jgi:hypothetical protein
MSSSKQARMFAYDNERRSRLGNTKSQFGKVGRNIDFESDKPRLAQERFVERPKAKQEEVDSTDKGLRAEMHQIEERSENEETDKSDFKKTAAPATVRDAPTATNNDLVTKHKAGGAFVSAWTITDHVVIPPVIQPKKSWFYPNYAAGSLIVNAMDRCIDGNQELDWICPSYFSLAVKLYYSIIFYIQILKAKEAAGKLERSEGTWFRSFKRVFPLESLPIAGPMVPYFSNIISVKPNDDKYDFIYPTYLVNQGLTVNKGKPSVSPEYYILPNVTFLAEHLAKFTSLTKAELENQTNNLDDYFDDTGAFVPHRTRVDFEFAGIEYHAQPSADMSASFSGIAMDKAPPETKKRCIEVHQYWKRSKITGMSRVPKSYDHPTIGDALRMSDDFEWFEECIHMATIQCKFMSESTNMSQIPATGGSEVLVSAEMTASHMDDKGNSKSPISWYPEFWKDVKAKFTTTRADTTPDQFANAIYALSTGTIVVDKAANPVGGYQAGHRAGPYWANREFEYQSDYKIEVARRIQTMITSLFYDAKGEAS